MREYVVHLVHGVSERFVVQRAEGSNVAAKQAIENLGIDWRVTAVYVRADLYETPAEGGSAPVAKSSRPVGEPTLQPQLYYEDEQTSVRLDNADPGRLGTLTERELAIVRALLTVAERAMNIEYGRRAHAETAAMYPPNARSAF